MSRLSPIAIAFALLFSSLGVMGWDWWISHDLETLEMARHLPMVGPRVERWAGADIKRKEVTIAVDASYPPFAFVEQNGALAGFEVDLASELGSRLAESPTVVNMDAADALHDALTAKRVDVIIAGLSYTPELARDIAYSSAYFEAGPGILVRTDRSDISEPRDLDGKKVAVEIGSLGEEEAHRLRRDLPGMELVTADSAEHALALVVGGGADATIVDRPSIPPGSSSLASLRAVAFPLRSQPYLVAVSRKDAGLLLAIDRELESMRIDGRLDSLDARWLR